MSLADRAELDELRRQNYEQASRLRLAIARMPASGRARLAERSENRAMRRAFRGIGRAKVRP